MMLLQAPAGRRLHQTLTQQLNTANGTVIFTVNVLYSGTELAVSRLGSTMADSACNVNRLCSAATNITSAAAVPSNIATASSSLTLQLASTLDARPVLLQVVYNLDGAAVPNPPVALAADKPGILQCAPAPRTGARVYSCEILAYAASLQVTAVLLLPTGGGFAQSLNIGPLVPYCTPPESRSFNFTGLRCDGE